MTTAARSPPPLFFLYYYTLRLVPSPYRRRIFFVKQNRSSFGNAQIRRSFRFVDQHSWNIDTFAFSPFDFAFSPWPFSQFDVIKRWIVRRSCLCLGGKRFHGGHVVGWVIPRFWASLWCGDGLWSQPGKKRFLRANWCPPVSACFNGLYDLVITFPVLGVLEVITVFTLPSSTVGSFKEVCIASGVEGILKLRHVDFFFFFGPMYSSK